MNYLLIRPPRFSYEINYYHPKIEGRYKSFFQSINFGNQITSPPLGLEYLAAALEQEGHHVEILDFYMENLSENRIKNVISTSDAVGITVHTINYKSASDICNIIKTYDPNIPIIIGGPHCSFLQERFMQDIPQADICVIGDGEHVIIEIAQFLLGRKNLRDISGIYYKERNKIKKGKSLVVIEDLDTLPFPARHLTKKYNYRLSLAPNIRCTKPKFSSMITSRGCPFTCRFCSKLHNNLGKYGFRQRSEENILKEFQELDGHYNSILITDDNFLVDQKK
jgi:anaerobic magnesium-protoporphyrin IX monomethyl ester cyclase